MRYKQLIYTSYKKYNSDVTGESSGYDVFAMTPGISEEERDELIAMFTNYAVPNDPRLNDLENIEKNVELYAPKQRAYLKLSTGRYCWCQVSLMPYDFSGRYNSIYFHAVLSDEEPDFAPVDFFENFTFKTKLTDDEFHARVTPPELREENIDGKLMQRARQTVKFERAVLTKILNSVLYCVRENKPLFFNCKTEEAYDTVKSVLAFLPVSLARAVYFSTYSSDEQEDGRAFRICHMGDEFGYSNRLSNTYVAVADLIENKFSEHIPDDAFIARLVEYAYTNAANLDRLKAFYENYTKGSLGFSSEALVNAYDFMYTEAYEQFDLHTFKSVISDAYITVVPQNARASRINAYLAANMLDLRERGVLLNEIYKLTADKRILNDYTSELLNSVVDGELKTDEAAEILRTVFGCDLRMVVLTELGTYTNLLSANIANTAVFELVVGLLLSAEKVDRAKADALYSLLFNGISAKGDLNLLTGMLLPSLKNSAYFNVCVKKIFSSYCKNAEHAAYWLDFCNNCADETIRDVFLNLTLEYVGSDELLRVVAVNPQICNHILALLKKIDQKNLCKDAIFNIICKLLRAALAVSPVADTAVNIIKFYDVLKYERIGELYDITYEVLQGNISNVFIKLAEQYGDDYVSAIARGKWSNFAENILISSIRTDEDVISRYIKKYYVKGNFRECYDGIMSAIEFGDDTRQWLFYGRLLNEVKGLHDNALTKVYTLLNAKLFDISHSDRKAVAKVISDICAISDIRVSKEIELVSRLINFDGKYKTAVELEDFILAVCSNDDKVGSGVFAYYYDVLLGVSLVIVKKKKPSKLLSLIYASGLEDEYIAKLWDVYFKKDKKAQIMYMLELMREDISCADSDYKNSLLKYFYGHSDEKFIAKFNKLLSKSKNDKFAASAEKYKN